MYKRLYTALDSMDMAHEDSSTATPRTRNARGHGDVLREQLLDAAQELIDERGGVAQLSIRAVTKRAGVSPMALYLHFATRDDLVLALVARGFDRFRAALHEARAAVAAPRAQLEAMGVAYLRFAREQPALYGVIFGPLRPGGDRKEVDDAHVPGPQIGREAFDDLVEAVADCPEAVDRDVKAIAIGLWAGLHGCAALRYARSGVGWPDEEPYVAGLTAAWLGAAPASTAPR